VEGFPLKSVIFFLLRVEKVRLRVKSSSKKKKTRLNSSSPQILSLPRRATFRPLDSPVAPSIMQSTLSMRSAVSQKAARSVARPASQARQKIKVEGEKKKKRRKKEEKGCSLFSSSSLVFSTPRRRAFLPPTRAHESTTKQFTKTTAHDRPGPPHGEYLGFFFLSFERKKKRRRASTRLLSEQDN
jgi:hypothetical protein